jgi:hypothetical protein
MLTQIVPELDEVGIPLELPLYCCCHGGGADPPGWSGGGGTNGGMPGGMLGLYAPTAGGLVMSGGFKPTGGGTGVGVHTDACRGIYNVEKI